MIRENYSVEISADAATVYDTMLGKETYKQWTVPFDPTSDFEGSWKAGEKILFTGVDENGNKGGMVAKIKEIDPNRYVAIEHIGMLDNGKEILDGPMLEGWAGAMEIYRFTENNGKTTVNVETDVNEKYQSYMAEAWPKALNILKEISENK